MKHSIKLLDRVRRIGGRRLDRGSARSRGGSASTAERGSRSPSRRSGGILVDSKGITLYDFVEGQGHDERLLRRLRRALAAADHEGQADRRPRRARVAARHDEAQGRQARGHLRRSPALLLRDRPQARPDDRPGRQPVRRPVVGPLARRQGDPPWLAHRARQLRRASGVDAARLARRDRPLPRRRLDPASSAPIHAQQYYDAYFSVVPTIGTLFLLSFIGAGVVGAALFAPVRLLGRRIGDLILVLAALGAIGIALGTLVSLLVSEYTPLFGFMESGYRLAIVLTLVFDGLTTVFLGVFVVIVGRRLVER